MGGDNAPISNVKGAVDAINEYKNVELIVQEIKKFLKKNLQNMSLIKIDLK